MTRDVDLPLAVSIGDPAGIGPEIISKAWQMREHHALPTFFVLGSVQVLKDIAPSIAIQTIDNPANAASHFTSALPVIDIATQEPVICGQANAKNSPMILEAIERGFDYVKNDQAAALVTSPINKHVLYDAGFTHKGHTDFLAHLCGQDADDAVMLLHSEELMVAPLTIHIPLKDVAKSISQKKIIKTATTMFTALSKQFGFSNPRIAVTGLNPHGGENGSMGNEEANIISPAIKTLQEQGFAVFGPFAADSLFSENQRQKYDAILAMYHDQALAPFKALDMRNGVNITLGLKGHGDKFLGAKSLEPKALIRTSPDHGTAYDMAGQNMADPSSFIAAIIMARRLARAHG